MNFPVRCVVAVWAVAGLAGLAGCGQPAAMNASTANVRHIAQGEFADQVTRAAGPVVVDFYATWCGPCRQLAPQLDAQADAFAGRIRFFKVNVDESPGLAQNFQIQAIPTVLFFKDGKLADRVTGLPAEADLKAKLTALAGGK